MALFHGQKQEWNQESWSQKENCCVDSFSINLTYGHTWNNCACVPSCYLELLDKLQKRICWSVRASLAASLEPLAHRRNLASISLFYSYYFGRCSSALVQLVPLPTCYSDRLLDFSVSIPRCYKNVYVDSFFPRAARAWNSLPIECFPLTYDLSGLKSRISRHLWTAGFF